MPTAELRWDNRDTPAARAANQAMLDEISLMIKAKERRRLQVVLNSWPDADLVALFIALPLKRARKLFEWRDRERLRVMTALHPNLRSALLQDASVSRIVEVLDSLDPEQVIRALADLSGEVSHRVMPLLRDRETVAEMLRHGEESAGSIMSRKFVAVPADWTVKTVVKEIRDNADTLRKIYGVSVVDEQRRPVGYLKLSDLLLLPKETCVRDVMHTDFVAVSPNTDQEEVARLADRYELNMVPVVDADGRLVGSITPASLRQIVRDEADEDLKIMAGLATDAQPHESVARIVRGRAPWLLIGLVGASMSGVVVGTFEEQLAKAAILASFIPIVMATAGNAGIQASTVAVQGLATGTLAFADLGWRLVKELSGAVINGALAAGILFALVIIMAQLDGDIAEPLRLATTAAIAELLVVITAVAGGATIPIILHRLGIDPALATGVFITTSNDILAVLIFFFMVTWIYFV